MSDAQTKVRSRERYALEDVGDGEHGDAVEDDEACLCQGAGQRRATHRARWKLTRVRDRSEHASAELGGAEDTAARM